MPIIKGHVVDKRSGAIVQQTIVTVQCLASNKPLFNGENEAPQGIFSIEIPQEVFARAGRLPILAVFEVFRLTPAGRESLPTDTKIQGLKAVDQELRILVEVKEEVQDQWTFVGRLLPANGNVVGGLGVEARDGERRLSVAETNSDGQFTIQFDRSALADQPKNYFPTVHFIVRQGEVVVLNTQHDALAKVKPGSYNLVYTVPMQHEEKRRQLSGRVLNSRRTAAVGLPVSLFAIRVGGETLLGSALTNSSGAYVVDYQWKSTEPAPDLQLVVYDARREKRELGRSPLRMQAAEQEIIDVLLSPLKDPQPIPEYQRVSEAMKVHMGDIPLSKLEENGKRRDITYLARKTGWDARLVAMTALAGEQSEQAKLPAELYYALFRAGLPTDPGAVSRLSGQTVERVWKQAAEAHLISESITERLPEYLKQFEESTTSALLKTRIGASVSSFGELVEVALPGNTGAHAQFTQRYRNYQGKPEDFWKELSKDFGEPVVRNLQLVGKLGFLTVNNAPLINNLRSRRLLDSDPVDLVRNGLYEAQGWREVLGDNIPLPDGLPGKNDSERRQNYAASMASQLQLSYPTAVMAQRIRRQELPLAGNGAVQETLVGFFDQHQAAFDIGSMPVDLYLKRNDLRFSEDEDLHLAALNDARRLQRVYQLTPSDQAMNVLLEDGLDSAYAIARLDEDQFVETYAAKVGGEDSARVVYAKAHQVHSTVTNIALAYGTYKTNPGIYAIAADHPLHGIDDVIAGESDVLAYATLEKLFGAMDFCACEHCRSVLSPAAYLVELLQFINQTQNLEGKENPINVLLDRRPDIEHLQLTCENTNTVLPYIDLVNEILEHQVVNGHLDAFTGFNIEEGISTAELLASPQFVNDAAYTVLSNQVYPMGLPFSNALETNRIYFNHLETPLAEVLKTLRTADDLAAWQPSYMEELGLTPEQAAILTNDAEALPVYFGLEAGDDLHATLAVGMQFAKELTRRLGISYKELTALVSTRWINPDSWMIPRLEKLYISLPTILAFLDGSISDSDFDALLPVDLDEQPYDGDVKAWLRAQETRIRQLILLVDPTGSGEECSFAQLEWRRAAGEEPGENSYWKLLRFVRLWRALGWSIELVDEAIQVLYPAGNAAASVTDLNEGFATLLIRLSHVQRLMKMLNLKPAKDLRKVLSLWAPIGSFGSGALYRSMFLNGSILTLDSVFREDANGEYLQDNTQTIGGHRAALLAAFNLKDTAFQLLLDELGFDDTSVLSLDNVSQLYRHAFLSRAMRLSIQELLIVRDLSGLNPFTELEDTQATTLRFVEIGQALKASGFKLTQLDYYLRHVDHSGKSSPAEKDIRAMLREARAALLAVGQENTAVEDPTGEQARAKIGMVYGEEAADVFFGLLDETATFTVVYDHSSEALEPAITAESDHLRYDDFAKQLQFTGVMSAATRDALTAVAGVSADFQDAVRALYEQSQALFDQHPDLGQLYLDHFAALNPTQRKEQYGIILLQLLPLILPALKRLALRQFLSGALSESPEQLLTLLENPEVLHADDPTQPLLEDLMVVEAGGFTADSPIPGQTRLQAYFSTPANGFYNLYVETDATAVELLIDGNLISGNLADGRWSNTAAMSLQAGNLYLLEILATDAGATPLVKWASTGLAKAAIPQAHLYPYAEVERFRMAYLRLLKALAMTEELGLLSEEPIWFAKIQVPDGGGGTVAVNWLNALPAPVQLTPAIPADVLQHVLLLLRYREARKEMKLEGADFVALLKNPAATTDSGDSLLWLLSGWAETTRDRLLAHFGWTLADLSDLERFLRFREAYMLLDKTGLSVDLLLAAATSAPTGDTVREVQAALRARYDASAWLEVGAPLHDRLRNRRRDALVAYVLHRMSLDLQTQAIDTPDKLFEYFLIDVEMDACMKTSRIKQAISSVQLFVYRCLLNLEKNVSPKAINARRWEWMKRYRVWEANRKVFLYPENWLEPELRDNKSAFFKELESELLQSDISEDTAAVALLHYLEKLDEISKLEICAMYLQENELKKDGAFFTADDIVHVIGRTSGTNRRYYYRRREYGYWTPWERVDQEIEDNPLLLVVWNNRLFLFWLSIMTKGPQNKTAGVTQGSTTKLSDAVISSSQPSNLMRVEATLCWSEYYNGKWQPRQTSNVNRPMFLGSFPPDNFQRDNFALDAIQPGGGELVVLVSNGPDSLANSYFKLYNKHSTPIQADEDDISIGEKCELLEGSYYLRNSRQFKNESGQFVSNYYVPKLSALSEYKETWLKHVVLRRAPLHDTVFPMHETGYLLETPFFFQDRRHVFYVTPQESQVNVRTFPDFGYTLPGWKGEYEILPKLWEEPVIFDPGIYEKIDPLLNVSLAGNPRWSDPSPLENRFQQSDLQQGINAFRVVNFKGATISAAGSVDALEIGALNLPR